MHNMPVQGQSTWHLLSFFLFLRERFEREKERELREEEGEKKKEKQKDVQRYPCTVVHQVFLVAMSLVDLLVKLNRS